MRREPSLTFRGALEILGHREHRAIERLDKLLGGVILAAGAGAGVAAVGPTAMAPLGMLAAVWGWLEQRDEALRLLRAGIDSISRKLVGTGTYERRQLIAAAHTTIVVAAFFEALQDLVGSRKFAELRITDAERETAAAGRSRREESLYDFLYTTEIPAPSPARGFEENCTLIGHHMSKIGYDLQALFDDSLAMKLRRTDRRAVGIDWSAVQERALERYRSRYLELATTVPEFMIWAMLGEHAATRASVAKLRVDVAEALDGSRDALSRVEALLTIDRSQLGAAARTTMAPDAHGACADKQRRAY